MELINIPKFLSKPFTSVYREPSCVPAEKFSEISLCILKAFSMAITCIAISDVLINR